MKNIKLYIGLLGTILITLSSCKNDLDVLAPGEETVSVYGILNPDEPIQNIRINKVYLTDGDALTSAQDVNQINYAAGELIVTLQRFMTGSTTPTLTTKGNNSKKEIVLTETVVTTAGGSFNINQRIWQTTDKLYKSGEYKLIIKRASDNSIIAYAQTPIIDSVSTAAAANNKNPFSYLPLNPNYYPLHGNYPTNPQQADKYKYLNNEGVFIQKTISFKSVPKGKIYDLIMRFHFTDSTSSGNVTKDSIDFNFNQQRSTTLQGGELFQTFKFTVNDFCLNLASELQKRKSQNIVARKTKYMEFIVYAGTDNLNTFLLVSQPSNTIAQDKPFYSNITNGVGVFACQSSSRVTKDLWADFIDKIACHPSTYPYLFYQKNPEQVATAPCPQ